MAAGQVEVFVNGLQAMLDGSVDFLSDTIQARLLDENASPDVDLDSTWGDVSANEVTDGDYSPQTLTTKTITINGSQVVFDSDDIDFGDTVTIEAKWLVIISVDATLANSPLLFVADLNTDSPTATVASVNDDFDLSINANGLHRVTTNT